MVCKVGFNLNKINVQGKLWNIPGPFLICCILLAVVLRSSATPLMLPVTAVGGLVACLAWKWRGVAFSSICLAGVLVYCLQMQPSQTWIWIIALTLSIASSFVVSVLCSEEAYHNWEALNKDSIDHKQTLAHLNERYQAAQSKLVAEQAELNSQVAQLQQQLSVKEDKQRSNEQLIKLARHEMTETFAKQERMLQELHQARQKNAAMEARIAELEELVNPELAQNYGKAVVQALEEKLEHADQQAHKAYLRIEAAESEKQELKKTLLQMQEELEKSAMQEVDKLARIEKELANAQAALAAMEENEAGLKAQIAQQKLTLGTSQASFKENEHMFLHQIAQLQSTLNAIQEVGEENEAKFKEQIEQHQSLLNNAKVEFEESEIKYQNEIAQHKQALSKVHNDFQESERKLKEQIAQLQSASANIHSDYHQNEARLKEQMAEKELALNELQALHFEAEEELEKHVKSLESLHRKYEDQNEKIIELEQQLENGAFEADKLQLQYEKLIQEKEALEQQHRAASKSENELRLINDHLLQQVAQLEKLREEHHEALQQLARFSESEKENQQHHLANLDLHNEAIALLRKEKEALSEQLQQLQQLQVKQEVPAGVAAEPVANVEVVTDSKEVRRIEGLYQQLRQQFAEKSETLSATRRELFATQEKLLALQKEHEEAAIDSGNETIESLQRVIAAAESELALLEHQHTVEINRLHEVIDSLMAHA